MFLVSVNFNKVFDLRFECLSLQVCWASAVWRGNSSHTTPCWGAEDFLGSHKKSSSHSWLKLVLHVSLLLYNCFSLFFIVLHNVSVMFNHNFLILFHLSHAMLDNLAARICTLLEALPGKSQDSSTQFSWNECVKHCSGWKERIVLASAAKGWRHVKPDTRQEGFGTGGKPLDSGVGLLRKRGIDSRLAFWTEQV